MLHPRCSLLFLVVIAACGLAASSRAQEAAERERALVSSLTARSDPNAAVLAAVHSMPSGGSYAASRVAFNGLARAITLGAHGLQIQPEAAQPSFCSGATYVVFVRALDELGREGALNLDHETQAALLISGQRDGQGIWGRWNANGPGTARLFSELQLGRNFTEFSDARPGDFMKIFWTDEIGKREHGHSVVFLGTNSVGGQEFVRFWSSNMPSGPGNLSGYGEKIIPRTKIARAIFSRLEHPANVARLRSIAGTDAFLASLLSRRVEMDEVRRMCGL